MNHKLLLNTPEERIDEKHEVFVRLRTSCWGDCDGLHMKKSLTYLKRKCVGFNVVEEDVSSIGADEVFSRIVDLGKLTDGVYKVVTCNEHRDWETGTIEDYDYKLLPVEP